MAALRTSLSAFAVRSRQASRRLFLGAAAAAPAACGLAADGVGNVSADGTTWEEPGRRLPLVRDADVVVCGAGPAGVSAAIAAARAGARVRLFEWRGCVGGIDRKSTRLNSSHVSESRMPSSA